MLELRTLAARRTGRATAVRTGVVAGLSAAALLVAPGAAMANGGNWAKQLGPTGNGCYVYSTWTSDTVAGHVYQQGSGYTCYVGIFQYWRSSGNYTGNDAADTSGYHQTASVPNNSPYYYYYYGPSGGDYLCVRVEGYNNATGDGAYNTYGNGC